MRSAYKTSVRAGIWKLQHLWMLCIWREGLSATRLSIQNQPHITVLVNNFTSNQRSLDICINAPKCLLALLPLLFDRRFTVSVSRDPPSLFSLIAQLAFHGPLWQLQPFRKAEFIPPLLFQPCIEEEVCGRDSMLQNVTARSGLSHGNQVRELGIFCARMRDFGGLDFFAPSLSGRLYLNRWALALLYLVGARSFLKTDFSISSLTYIVVPSPFVTSN